MSKRNLQRALRIERNLTDSMKELLDTGEITKTFASDTIASLSKEDQEELISKNEKKKLEGNKLGADVTNGKAVSLQLEADCDRSLNTDRQTAQKAGVGVGTVARYNKVMNSNEEDLKEQVKTGQVTVNKAYEEIRKRETRVCKMCGKEKKIIHH